MKKLLLKIKNIRFPRFVFADIYKVLSIFLLTLIQIPGMIFWGAVWFEVDMDLPHFNYKQFLESDIFRALLLISFLYSIGLLIFRKIENSDECSFAFGDSTTGIFFDGGKSHKETVQKITEILVENRELKNELQKIQEGTKMKKIVVKIGHDVEFKHRDKIILEGVMGTGKTVQLEKIALKLNNIGVPFIFITSMLDGLFNIPESRILQSMRDFLDKFVNNQNLDALVIELYDHKNRDKNTREEIKNQPIPEDILHQINALLERGAVLLIDESDYVLENNVIRNILIEALKKENQGVVITCQSIDSIRPYIENEK